MNFTPGSVVDVPLFFYINKLRLVPIRYFEVLTFALQVTQAHFLTVKNWKEIILY